MYTAVIAGGCDGIEELYEREMKTNDMRLVLIEWLDSFGCSTEWRGLKDISPSPNKCRSVGWLIHDGEDCKVIVPHISDPDHANATQQGCGDMTIPVKAIVSIVDLNSMVNLE